MSHYYGSWVQRPFWSFADVSRLELLKWLAVVAMVCDHVAITIAPGHPWLREVGTFAFPVFFLAFGVGLFRTNDPLAVARRLLLPALVAQAAWYVIDPGHSLNVLFVCAFCAASVHLLRALHRDLLASLGLGCLVAGLVFIGVEGGLFGFLLIAGAFLAARGSHWLVIASVALWLVFLPSWGFLIGVLAVYLAPSLGFAFPRARGVLAGVYAGHLVGLAVLMRFFGEWFK